MGRKVPAKATLMSLLGAAGHRPPVLTGPVEVMGRAPADLAPQGVGAALGDYAPSRVDLDHQRGSICWGGQSKEGRCGRTPCVSLPQPRVPQAPQAPRLARHPHLGCGPTYPAAGTGPLARWGYPCNPGHTCQENKRGSVTP